MSRQDETASGGQLIIAFIFAVVAMFSEVWFRGLVVIFLILIFLVIADRTRRDS